MTVLGDTYAEAVEKAYEAVSRVTFEGMYFRTDIGRKALGYLKRSPDQQEILFDREMNDDERIQDRYDSRRRHRP